MPEGTINGEPYKVPEGYAVVDEDRWYRALEAQNLLMDLDRSPHGRHEGDVEYQDDSGFSQGNPHLNPGDCIGYTIGGKRIVMPEGGDLGDAERWIEGRPPTNPTPKGRNPE